MPPGDGGVGRAGVVGSEGPGCGALVGSAPQEDGDGGLAAVGAGADGGLGALQRAERGLGRAAVALVVAVRRDMGEDDADVRPVDERLRLPDVGVPAACAAMQVAADAARRVVERRQADRLAVQLEDALGDAVAA